METLTDSIPLSPGDMVGWYRIERPLGRGGFGITYLAHDTNLDVQVAIKEYLPQTIATRNVDHTVCPITADLSSTFSWGLDRFINEARTLALFNHDSIVRVMSVFEKNQTAYMIMEYVSGADLTGKLDSTNFVRERNLKALVDPLLDGLEVVHKQGFIHRDIKPANIRIPSDGRPAVLLDFGSARQALTSKTQSLTAMVSEGYAPLEQYNCDTAGDQGPWTDIYALGAVLYRAISGQEPISSTLRVSACVNDRTDPLVPTRDTTRNEYSSEFLDAIDWALCWRVADRPQSISEWRSRLFERDSMSGSTFELSGTPESESPESVIDAVGKPPFSTKLGEAQRQTDYQRSRPSARSHLPRQQQSSHRAARAPAPARTLTRQTALQRTATSRRETPQKSRQSPSKRRRKRTGMTLLSAGSVVLFLGLALNAMLDSRSSDVTPSMEADGRADAVQRQSLPGNPDSGQAIDASRASDDQRAMKSTASRVSYSNQALTPTGSVRMVSADEYTELEQPSVDATAGTAPDAASIALSPSLTAIARDASLPSPAVTEDTSRSQVASAQELDQRDGESERERLQQATQARLAAVATAQAKGEPAHLEPIMIERSPAEADTGQRVDVAPTQVAMLNSTIDPPLDDSALMRTDESAGGMVKPTNPRAISDTELSLLSRRFHELKEAIVQRDVAAISRLTENSLTTNRLIFRLFDTFDGIEVEVSGITAGRSQQLVQAKIEFGYLLRSNGNRQLAPEVLRDMTLRVYREADSWSQIQW